MHKFIRTYARVLYAYCMLSVLLAPKKQRVVVASGTFAISHSETHSSSANDRSTHGASKSNIKNDTSVRGRMGENLYFSSVSGACLARFFGRRLSAVKSPFAVLLPIVHSAFAFLSCRLMPLQPFLPGYSLLHPAFNARFFSVHLFRRARSLDCLGRCAKGLDDSGPPFFFLFLPLSSLLVAPYLFVRIPLSISEYIPHRHIVSLDI